MHNYITYIQFYQNEAISTIILISLYLRKKSAFFFFPNFTEDC